MLYATKLMSAVCSDGVLSDGFCSACRTFRLPLYPSPSVPPTGCAEYAVLALLLGSLCMALCLRVKKKRL